MIDDPLIESDISGDDNSIELGNPDTEDVGRVVAEQVAYVRSRLDSIQLCSVLNQRIRPAAKDAEMFDRRKRILNLEKTLESAERSLPTKNTAWGTIGDVASSAKDLRPERFWKIG